ncbi:uncharacterized protein LOC127854071 [Dreissena polymorpha]|uniref:Uncharacterized protein n=1 Tax=Dreissena polymorpha TaxID=45954 RepID=A0A9D4HLV2_DREPO|nr:uncharacterized protein LOC127854071 [Dreissena polymorpha]KAH3725262.1 hypothetical protein DPMN_051096 [Dreissena polymorpha]
MESGYIACVLLLLNPTLGFILNSNDGPVMGFAEPLMIAQLEESGWNLVFRGTSGNGHNTLDAWMNGVGTSSTKPMDMSRSYDSHFRDNYAVTHWASLGVKYVKFALYKQSREVVNIVFNGTGSDMTSWFAQQRVLVSSYSDITPTNTYNFFSIQGHIDVQHVVRTFFINQIYHGCDGDVGNVVVLERDGDCNWDHQPRYPQFLYSDLNAAENWNQRMFGRADYLAIFVYTGQ